jgi:hypothetical protein
MFGTLLGRSGIGLPGIKRAPLSIDPIIIHDLASDAGDKRGLAPAALLVGCAKPVPAFRLVCLPGLGG